MTPTTAPADVKIAQTPPMPTFKTVGEERLHRKQRLASAFRLVRKSSDLSRASRATSRSVIQKVGGPLLGQSLWHALCAHPGL